MSDVLRAQRILDLAWADLPAHQRLLLENIGCTQRLAVASPLGSEVSALYLSADLGSLAASGRSRLDEALGVWVPALRLLVVNAAHPALEGLDEPSREHALAWVAWHEWGHALALNRASGEDVANGRRLLDGAPTGVSQFIRAARYRNREVTHELVAEMYALLMARRRRGATDKPKWLEEDLWELVTRTTDWTE